MLHPRENPHFFGHKEVEAHILQAMQQDKFPHALLLTGPRGLGKATFAFRLARTLLAQGKRSCEGVQNLDIDNASSLFRRVAAGSHGDLFTLQRLPGKEGNLPKFITVDDVRSAISFSRKTPAECGWRVVIVDSADELNKNAANALLKLLEEPPAHSLIMLIAAMPGRLPVTLRSRCQMVPFATLAPEEVEKVYVSQARPVPSSGLYALGDGAPGQMMRLEEEGGEVIYAKLLILLNSAFQGQGMRAVMGLQKHFDQKPEAVQLLLQFLSGYIGKIMNYLSGQTQGITAEDHQCLNRLKAHDLGHWVQVWQNIQSFHQEAQIFNLDWRQTLEGIVHLIESPISSKG